MKLQIRDNLVSALAELGIHNDDLSVDTPANLSFGDYTTNTALKLSKKLGKNPLELAQEIVSKLPKSAWLEKVEVVKPGFINFHISPHFHLERLQKMIQNDKTFFESTLYKDKKIMFEYTDPNPFKEFHIGHLYSNAVGESLARIVSFLGADVKRANYYGDVGMHVAKSIWGLQKKLKEDALSLSDLEKRPLRDKVRYLGQAYAVGAQAYEDDEKAKEEMRDINYAVFVAGQEYLKNKKGIVPTVDYRKYLKGKHIDLDGITKLYMKGKDWSLEAFEIMYKILGTKFDYDYPESMMAELGQKMVLEYLGKGIFKKSEGAVIFEGEKYGLHDRVFINSLGLPTYEAKDLGNAPTKYKDFPYDKSFIVTANEINEYFKVVLTALGRINPSLAKKTVHIGHGIVRLPEGKMSSRTGKIMTGEALLRAAEEEVHQFMRQTEVEENEREKTIEKIAVAAVKFALLKQGIGSDIEFSLEESVSFTGNSGPYIQYTIVRCESILDKAGKTEEKTIEEALPLETEELNLLRLLSQFPDIVFQAAEKISPHLIANYLFTVAQKFSLFYEMHPILKAPEKKKEVRLLLTRATAGVLTRGLWLLGIESVRKM